MAKPKAKETVVWDDDDMWSDVEVDAQPAAEPELPISPLVSQSPQAAGQPLELIMAPATIVEIPAKQVDAALRVPSSGDSHDENPPKIRQETIAPNSGVRGVSLTKNNAEPNPEPPPQATAPTSPPPLLVTAKPAAQPAPAATRQTPPPLPIQPPPVSKSPARKPAGGVSSIFLGGGPAAEKPVVARKPEPQSFPKPKPKIHHPKLGPAFARDFPPENEA